MKITRKKLEKIIKEEIEDVIRTVSINQLEDTVTELSSSAEKEERLQSLRWHASILSSDIKNGFSDDKLDSIALEYECATPDKERKEGAAKVCAAIKRRKLALKKSENHYLCNDSID